MWKKVIYLVAIVVCGALMVAMLLSFRDSGERFLASVESVPGENEVTSAAPNNDWIEIYDLELTGVQMDIDQVVFAGEQALVLDRARQIVVLVDLATKNFLTLPDLPAHTQAVWLDDDGVFVYAGSVWTYREVPKAWAKLTPDFDFPEEIAYLRRFGNNFYLFGEGLVRRVAFDAEEHFVELTDWLDEDVTAPSEISDVAIDGYIYFASQGEPAVSRFLRGTPDRNYSLPGGGQIYLATSDNWLLTLTPRRVEFDVRTLTDQKVIAWQDEWLREARFLGYSSDDDTLLTLHGRKFYRFAPGLASYKSVDQNIAD